MFQCPFVTGCPHLPDGVSSIPEGRNIEPRPVELISVLVDILKKCIDKFCTKHRHLFIGFLVSLQCLKSPEPEFRLWSTEDPCTFTSLKPDVHIDPLTCAVHNMGYNIELLCQNKFRGTSCGAVVQNIIRDQSLLFKFLFDHEKQLACVPLLSLLIHVFPPFSAQSHMHGSGFLM